MTTLVPPLVGLFVCLAAVILEITIAVIALIINHDSNFTAGVIIGFIAGLGAAIGTIGVISNLFLLLIK